MGGKAPKQKGNGFERELCAAACAASLPAKRAWGSDGRSMGLAEDVDVVIAGWKIQAKRRAAISQVFKPSSQAVDAVAYREDRGETYVMIRLRDFLQLIGGDY